MGKERGRGPNESLAIVNPFRATPGIPRFPWKLGGTRRHPEQVDHHELAIMIPAALEKSILGLPPHGDGCVVVEEPVPIDPIQNRGCVLLDSRIGMEMIPSMDHATESDGTIDGGEFAFPDALTGAPMKEMKKETVVMRLPLGEPGKRSFDL